MHKPFLLSIALIIGATGPAGLALADPIDYNMTQAGASSPSGIRPGDIVTALDTLVLDYNNGLSWNVTLGDDPVRVLDTQPTPQAITLGELISHTDSSCVIYDRLAVRAVVQWIGYDNGSLPSEPTTIGYLTDEGLYDISGQFWTAGTSAGSPSGSTGGQPPLSLIPVPEPSTLAITVIVGSAALSLFRRKRYQSNQ